MRESTIGIFGADFATAGAASERKAPELAEDPSTVSITGARAACTPSARRPHHAARPPLSPCWPHAVGNTPQRRSRLAADIDEDATDLLTAPATNRSLSAIRACSSYSSSPQSPYSAPIGRQHTSYSRLGAGHSEDVSGNGVVLFSDGAQRRRASMPADSRCVAPVDGTEPTLRSLSGRRAAPHIAHMRRSPAFPSFPCPAAGANGSRVTTQAGSAATLAAATQRVVQAVRVTPTPLRADPPPSWRCCEFGLFCH